MRTDLREPSNVVFLTKTDVIFTGGKSWAYTWVSLKGWALFLRCSVPDTVTLSIDASLINLQAIRTQHFTNITCHLHKWFEVGLTTRKEQCTAGQVLLALHLITSFPRSCCHMYVYSRPISARSKNKFCLTFGNFFFFGVSSCPFLESFDWLVCARYLSLKMFSDEICIRHDLLQKWSNFYTWICSALPLWTNHDYSASWTPNDDVLNKYILLAMFFAFIEWKYKILCSIDRKFGDAISRRIGPDHKHGRITPRSTSSKIMMPYVVQS